MDLFSIERKPFRDLFIQFTSIMLIAIVITTIVLRNGYVVLPSFDPNRKFTWPILICMIVLAVFYTAWRKRKIEATFDHQDFYEQVEEYRKVYTSSLRWHLFSCLVSCFLAILSGRSIFLIYAGFDLLFTLPMYPTALLFRKELRNDEITVY